jgi:hypothetical protein
MPLPTLKPSVGVCIAPHLRWTILLSMQWMFGVD